MRFSGLLSGQTLEDELEQFRRLDGICLMICRDEIRSLLTARLPRGDDDQDSAALGILQRTDAAPAKSYAHQDHSFRKFHRFSRV